MAPVLVFLDESGGGIRGLPLSLRLGLFAALALVCLVALVVGARDPAPATDARRWWRLARVLLPLEAAVGLVALVAAGTPGGEPPPPQPPAAPVAAALAGSPLLLTSAGRHLVPVAVAPGLPGENRIVVGVQDLDLGGVPQPATGITGVELSLRCGGCTGTPPAPMRLKRVGDGPWYAGTATLAAGSWSLTPMIGAPGAVASPAVTALIDPPRPGDLLVGTPADLSGPFGTACQNHAAGLELALAGSGDGLAVRPRVVLEDIAPRGAAAATERLAARGVRILAAPCGQGDTLGAVAGVATRLRLPLVGALRSEGASPYVWRTGIDQGAEGTALARQVHARGAAGALLLVGPRAEQVVEAAAVEDELGRQGVAHQRLTIGDDTDPALVAAELRARNPEAMVMIATPRRALPVVEAVSRTGWRPARGIVASSDLMSVSFVEDAAPLLRDIPMAIASELDPGDAASRDYRDLLHRRLPLRSPGIEGARGYYAGLLIDRAAAAAGSDPSSQALERALQTDFTDYHLGLFQLMWGAGGGGPDRLAFFEPVAGGAGDGGDGFLRGGRLQRDGHSVVVG